MGPVHTRLAGDTCYALCAIGLSVDCLHYDDDNNEKRTVSTGQAWKETGCVTSR